MSPLAPTSGLSSEERLNKFMAAVYFGLTPNERKYLEEPYMSKPVRRNQDRTTP